MDIVQKARELGFDQVGITPATPSSHTPTYATWASAGYAGEMSYLIREEALRKRAGVAELVPGARSVIVVAKSYSTKIITTFSPQGSLSYRTGYRMSSFR